MSVENNQDETAGFVTTSSDMPEVQAEPQEEQQQEEQANSEAGATVGDEEQDPKGEAEEPKAEEQDDSGKDTAADHDKGKKPNRVQKRIDQVVREREQERREKEALQRRIDELESGKQSDKSEKEPVEDDFETYDEYLDALDAYDNKQPKAEEKKTEPKQDEQEQSSELTDSQKTAMAVIKESVDSADKPEDFEAVALNPEVPVTGEMLEALAECEDPAKVMYHLGQNKDLAADIASGSPAQQMRAIAKLDLTVTSKPPKPTKTTNAPDPISPVGGSDAQEKAPAEMSFAEYEAHMNKKERSRQSW
ncbi:head scaffolding protein [Shewanella phage X14]|uniref:Coil containing protein n=1 Tax=Shewanella phage X14 TaxID=2576871 RepID=A0A4P8NLL1_9CAUD|nr:head scaffolding protein [Shewanella phage X14]QCQ65287.1 scaffolding protein [Shewanella phage X14]